MSYYTYIYLDPRKPGVYRYENLVFDYEPLYVGKGTGNRAYYHLHNNRRVHNPILRSTLNTIKSLGQKPVILILSRFENEEEAYAEESRLIQLIGSRVNAEIKEGPLVNICLKSQPRSQKGRTYEDIYKQDAESQRIKRRQLQIDAGGYFGGHHHSETTKALLAEKTRSNNLKRVEQGVHMTESTRKKIAQKARERIEGGYVSPNKRTWLVIDPKGERFLVKREDKETLNVFCVRKNISCSTLQKTLTGFVITRGRTKGWSLHKIDEDENPSVSTD